MKRSAPERVAFRDEHPRVADGEDVDFILYRLVHDAIGTAENLVETVCVVRYGHEAFIWDGRSEKRKCFKLVGFFLYAQAPSGGILRRTLNAYDMKNVGEERFSVRRPLGLHALLLLRIQPLIISSISRKTSSLGIPLPSANSRREISMSWERLRRSSSVGHAFSCTLTGAAKPRCSKVCMRRMFMPVDVVMPSRSKRASARFLISGFTRNAIVAEFIYNSPRLFNNCEHYSISAQHTQASEESA